MENDGLTDARLRDLYQRALAQRGERARERCVAPEAILALTRREGPEKRRLEVLDHVMGCNACRAEFDLLRSIEQAGAEAERPAIVPRHRWGWLSPVALAAALVLAVGVGVKLGTRGAPDVERGTGDAVTLLAPAAETDAGAPVTFAWRPVSGALRYEIEVLDEQGKVVFARTTEQTSATLSDAGLLVPGSSYRWWVRAASGAGEPRSSPLRSLRIRLK
ncbi:MAG TPA: fibronectin type III domain-containing protein [Haliangiales bacterium]|nr:fibronectin type III domain-containing protein [Haliangiales bacterium]